MIKCVYIAILAWFFLGGLGCQTTKAVSGKNISELDAVKIAETSLVKKFGPNVLSQRPFVALKGKSSWTVTGTIQCGNAPRVTCAGGAAEAVVSFDGHVLKMDHDE